MRGVALKVLDVEGARLEGSEGDASQDVLTENGSAFGARTAKAILGGLRIVAKTTDRATWAKRALSAVLRAAEKGLGAVGGESATLKVLSGARNLHPLGETSFTQTAFRHGAFVGKQSLVPVSPSLTRLTGIAIDARGRPDAIREEMIASLPQAPAEWELRVQLSRDAEAMPVEDATVLWDEALSRFLAVARIRADPQPAWTDARAAAVDDAMRFSPWTSLEAHRPLGVINRVRKDT